MKSNSSAHGSGSHHHRIRHHGARRFWLILIISLVAVLVVIRMVLPTTVQWYVNKKLDEAPDYEGSIGDVDLHLYRGAYSVDNVDIRKSSGDVPVPLFSTDKVEFSILWSALLRKSIVADITFYSPEINIVDDEDEEDSQTGEDANWLGILNDLVPFRIDMVTIHQGALFFRKFDEEIPVNVSISDLEATLTNLANSEDLISSRSASLQGQGTIADTGKLLVNAKFDPFSQLPTFDLDVQATGIEAEHVSGLVIAYLPLDLENGELSVVIELESSAGTLTGYVKPLAHNLEIVSWQGDVIEDKDNPLQLAWESVVGILSEIFENQSEDQLATIIPLEGQLDSPDTDNWAILGNILKNAFIEAFNLNFENAENTTVSTEQENDNL